MADHTIRINTKNLRAAADNHETVGDELAAVPGNHSDVLAWARGLGPAYEEWITELGALLQDRHNFYTDEADEQNHLANGLDKTADMFTANEQNVHNSITEVGTDL